MVNDHFLQTDVMDSIAESILNIASGLVPELPAHSFMTDLAFIMIMGAAITLAFFKIRQPIITGYLFAGMLLGPLSPIWLWIFPQVGTDVLSGQAGILEHISALHLFSEIGVVLLLFGIGIEFPYAKIRSIGTTAIGIGSIGLFGTMAVIFYVAGAIGLNFMDSLFIAAALSISSTAVILKLLEDSGRMGNKSSIMILGILIVEDIIAVVLISTLQSVALAGTISVESLAIIGITSVGLIGGTFTIGIRVIPKIIDKIAATENREILLLSILGLCFGYSLLASMGGLSVAIGAFLAGVLVAGSKSIALTRILSKPIKDMFVAIFFISTGALMDISQIGDFIWLALALIVATAIAKFGGNIIGSAIFKQGRTKATRMATALAAPRGEFSIVIVKTGVDIGAVSTMLFPMMGVIAIITTFITPMIMKVGEKTIPKAIADDD